MALEATWISPAATQGSVPAVGDFSQAVLLPSGFGGCRLPGSRQEPQHCKVVIKSKKQSKNYSYH